MTTRREIYIGVFLISLATLMFEILLTRVFSVTMWHHFAFMAVSLAMFGTTAGAGAVFLAPRYFEAHRATFQMGVSSLLFAASTVGSVLILTGTRFVPEISWESLDSLTFIYVIAADLVGTGLGCLVFAVAIGMTDAVTTAFAVAWLGVVASCFFLAREAAEIALVLLPGLLRPRRGRRGQRYSRPRSGPSDSTAVGEGEE